MTRQSFQKGHISQAISTKKGTIFKIRYRVRLADGSWKHKAETLYGISSRKAARLVLERRIQETAAARVDVGDLTFEAFVELYWKPYLKRKNVRPSTLATYESAMRLHILPAFRALRISRIVPLDIERLLQTRTANGLSSKTVRNLAILLQGVFSLAEDNDVISRSPVRKIHKPTIHHQEKSVWTPKQLREIIAAAPAHYQALFTVAALTGARLGEILAIQWQHVNLTHRSIRIEQALWGGRIFPPKTPASSRTIYFGEGLARTLEGHYRNAVCRSATDFIFGKVDGASLHPDVLRKDILYPTLDRLGIPRTAGSSGFHKFRHSAASIINEKTGNLKLAQKLLGHATVDITADVYTHTSAEAEREASLAVERAIYGDLFPNPFPTGNSVDLTAVN